MFSDPFIFYIYKLDISVFYGCRSCTYLFKGLITDYIYLEPRTRHGVVIYDFRSTDHYLVHDTSLACCLVLFPLHIHTILFLGCVEAVTMSARLSHIRIPSAPGGLGAPVGGGGDDPADRDTKNPAAHMKKMILLISSFFPRQN